MILSSFLYYCRKSLQDSWQNEAVLISGYDVSLGSAMRVQDHLPVAMNHLLMRTLVIVLEVGE